MHKSEEPCSLCFDEWGCRWETMLHKLGCCCKPIERLLQALLLLTAGLAAAGGDVANERDLVEAWSSPLL
jgi:hypothetical protein